MYESNTCSRRGWVAAAALLLALTLLLCACSKNKDKASDSSAQTTAAPETTAEATEAPVETTAAPVETEAPVPETEPAPVTEPVVWNPTINRDDISFFGPGETFVLVVNGVPADAEIVWTAENETIAAVDEVGRVTAVGPGSARIYAEVGEKKLTCWIRCQFEAPVGEDVPYLNKTDMSFFGVGEFFRLTVENAPEDAEIVWTSEDYSVANVDENGKVTAVGPGTIKVKAEVGEYVLSCWVRCQFAAPEKPRSSVADGTWLVRMTKGRVTALNESGDYSVEADILVAVRVVKDYLDALEPGSDLNLSAYGYGVLRVESVQFNDGGTECTVTTSTSKMLFVKDESGKWTLTEDGEAVYYRSGTARLIFDANSVCLDKMSAVVAGQADPIRRDNVADFFDKLTGYENELPRVSVTVSDGIVTQAVWNFHR